MARFVTFPGTAGSYASTDDVNLLDADTAHIQQSVGWWISGAGTSTVTQDATHVQFGDFSLLMTANGTSRSLASTANSVGLSPDVVAGTVYATGWDLYTAEPDREARISGIWRDAGGGNLGNYQASFTDIAQNAFTRLTFSQVAPATAVRLQLFIEMRIKTGSANPGNGELLWGDSFVTAVGTDAAFVPSLRIVGDLDIDFDVMVTGLGVQQSFLTRRGTAGNRAFNWFVNASDLIRFQLSSDGTAETSVNSSIAITSAERHLYRVTYLAADGTVSFFQDGAPFGDSGSVAAGGAFPAPKDVEVGTYINGTTAVLDGDVYAGSLKDGIDGPVVCVFDPDDITI